jgi:hypothetical protein
LLLDEKGRVGFLIVEVDDALEMLGRPEMQHQQKQERKIKVTQPSTTSPSPVLPIY